MGVGEKNVNTSDLPGNGFRAVIFDLDGTLLNTLDDIGDSVNQMLAEFGFPGHTLDDYRRFIGNGIGMLVKRALPADSRSTQTVDACVGRARAIYWENWNRKTRPYDGISELLDQLASQGLPLAVLSNKPHDFTVRYVQAYFDRWDFKMVLGQSDRYPVKPDPASALAIAAQIGLPPEQFLLVGDSSADMQTASAAGMYAVGVAWGFRGPGELMTSGCRTLVHHPLEILALL